MPSGVYERTKMPLALRFWTKVDRSAGPDACWMWTASTDANGYGRFWLDERRQMAHRIAYTTMVGPIPAGLQLDHLCRNTSCVNPAHLEPVTNRENVLRGTSPLAAAARQTHCIHGHPLSGDNLIHRRRRQCRTCIKAWNAAYNRRRPPRRPTISRPVLAG